MNIVYIYRSLTTFGGVERIFTDKANYLADKLGNTVYIITFEQGEHPITYPLSDKVIHIDLNICFYKQYQYGKLKRLQMQWKMEKEFHNRLTELFARIKADIVICASCEFTVMRIMTKLKVPIKKIIETHGAKSYIEKGSSKESKGILKLAFKIKDLILHNYIRKTDAFVTLTDSDANDWITIAKAYTIPNILTKYPEQIDAITKKGKRVISVGRLTEQKGYDLLLQAWQIVHRNHSDWKLDIYGDGEDYAALLQEIEDLRLEQSVIIHEPTPDIYNRYMESDFYVMSSRWEGFGLVLAEAMSCGVPCVSFACQHGPSDIIRDGEDGILVEKENVSELAEKIRYLIENENIRIEMGRKARENIKRYLPENVMPQWMSLFESLIKTDK